MAKGPYFARYGDLATAGAVAFQTADSLREDLVKLEADPFLDKTYRAVALLRAPISAPGVTAYFGGEVYSSEGYFEKLLLSPKASVAVPINDDAEVGFRYGGPNDLISGSAAGWMLNLESEFVYIGDEGSTNSISRPERPDRYEGELL